MVFILLVEPIPKVFIKWRVLPKITYYMWCSARVYSWTLLFLIYINDMNLAVEHSTIYHFADDTHLLYSCKSFKELRKRVNKDLQLLYEWLCANRLSLNTGKTEFIVFRPSRNKTSERLTLKLHHTKLFESSKIKYLGIIIDNKLNWKGHITELSKKLSRAVGLIYKIRHTRPTAVLRSLCFSIFHSYGLMVLCFGVLQINLILIKLEHFRIELSRTLHLQIMTLTRTLIIFTLI